jgi:DNA-binding LacI/PurR family transcriptional regulator
VANPDTSVDIVPGNKVPLYLQVAQVIKKRVRTGLYKSQNPLPSVRQLGKELGVTSSVVHRAVRSLERSGVVVTQHGKDMVIANEDPCEQAAILFGFIHPYYASDEFCRYVLGFVNEAFEDRANLAMTRTSKNDSAREREVAGHLIANGAKGLLVWGVSNDENSRYFMELSERIPIVLVDRLMSGADLPAVVLDHYGAGWDVVQHLLKTMGKKRLLVLMDNLRIDAYDEMIRGIQESADDLGRSADLTLIRYPMLDIVGPVTHWDYSVVQEYRGKVERLLREGNYDAVFTNYGLFLDRVMAETGLLDDFGDIQLATLCNQGRHTGSRRFSQLAPLQWDINFAEMIAVAADILQELVLNRRNKIKVIRIPIRRLKNIRKRKD